MSTDRHTSGLMPAPQTDQEAANSAAPDTDRLPAWNDPDWDSYLWAVDPDYRIEWYLDHDDEEAARDEVEELRERKIEDGEWTDDDEEDYLLGWCDDDEDVSDDPVGDAIEARAQEVAGDGDPL